MIPGFVNGTNPIHRLRQDMDALFERMFEELPGVSVGLAPMRTFPAVNVWEDGENVYMEAELPGIDLKDLDLSVVGNELTLRGERKETKEDGASYHRRERGVGAFSRVIRLPVDINADAVEAGMHDGVLLITLPKAESAKPRKVQIKALLK